MKIEFASNEAYVYVTLVNNTSKYIWADKTFQVFKEQNTKYFKGQNFSLSEFENCAENKITVVVI